MIGSLAEIPWQYPGANPAAGSRRYSVFKQRSLSLRFSDSPIFAWGALLDDRVQS